MDVLLTQVIRTKEEAVEVLKVVEKMGLTVDQLIAEEIARLRAECCKANEGL